MYRDEPLLFTKSIRLFSNLRYIYKEKEEQNYEQAEWVGSWVSHWYKDRLNVVVFLFVCFFFFFCVFFFFFFFFFFFAVIKRKSDNHMGFFQEYLMAL